MSTENTMPEPVADLDRPEALSAMLELGQNPSHAWKPDEMSEILKHQMKAPLVVALGTLSGEAAALLEKLGSRQQTMKNLDDLLHDPQPPIELLALTKRFGKRYCGDPDRPLPREIAILLYYTSIAVAELRCGKRLSALPPEVLREGLQWCRDQDWVDEPTRRLLNEALGVTSQKAVTESKAAMPSVHD